MDVVCRVLVDEGFVSVSSQLGRPIVVNCVPGAGKSRAIRKILEEDSRFQAFTFGAADSVNIRCRRIAGVTEFKTGQNKYVIVDEYQLGDWKSLDPIAIFGDPCQSEEGSCSVPHFISTKTRRFGRSTCELLRAFDFEIESEQEDTVEVVSNLDGDVDGEVIACGPEAEFLLNWWGCPFKKFCEVRGSTFEVVTLVTDYSTIPVELRVPLFICLTRHRRRLRILNGDATFAPTR